MSNFEFEHFNRSIMEIIKNRCSVRSYSKERISEETKNKLLNFADSIIGPFHSKVRLEFIDSYDILQKSEGKIGTYGIIKDAQHFIVSIVKDEENNLMQLGYILEKFILYATSLGLGTCWMGGTFKRSDFAKLVNLGEGEMLPIVTPIGYPQEKRTVVDNFMRYAARSNQRKSWSQLFYNEGFDVPIDVVDVKEYAEALEAVRLAPSASNKQPWIILKINDTYSFYLKHNKRYAEGLGFNIQEIDMGIAMCHFEMVLQEKGIKGFWRVENLQHESPSYEGLIYCVSWVEASE